MPCEFYAQNSKMTGCALFVSFSSKEGYVFCQLRKQTGWNPTTKKGSFKGGATLALKLSPDEIGSIIHAIRVGSSVQIYHTSASGSTKGRFAYYEIGEGESLKRGYGLSLNKDNVDFKVSLTEGGAERLSEYLKFALTHIFSADYARDKAKAKEKFDKEAKNPEAQTDAVSETAQDEPPDAENGDF